MQHLFVQNGLLSALPYLGAWMLSTLSGVVADLLIERRVFSVTVVRKLFTLTGKETSLWRLNTQLVQQNHANMLYVMH